MKNREIKYQVILIFCCFFATLTACSPHSFRSKKHQRSNFLGKKKERQSVQAFIPNDSIKFNSFELINKSEAASIKTDFNAYSNKIESIKYYNKAQKSVNNSFSPFGTKSLKIKDEVYKKERPPDEKKARIYERGSKRFFWLFFIILTITFIASVALLEYFILPFIGGVILLIVPLILHSIFSQNVIKFSNNDSIKKKARTNFWVLLGIYLLLAIALLIVCSLLFV